MTHSTNPRQTNASKGFVSIFTLMFFIILSSVFTVGFMRIVLDETQQAMYNSSTNSALAAARAGIEDAKRAIILYNSLPDGDSLKNDLEAAFASPDCNAIYGDTDIANALKLDPGGKVQTTNLDEQYYTCLKVKTDTPTYETTASPSRSAIIPLVGSIDFNRVFLRWHKIGADADGIVASSSEVSGTENPPVTGFPSGLPTFMRLQLIIVPNNGSIDNVESHTGFLRTSTATVVAAPPASAYFMKDLDSAPPKLPGRVPCVASVLEYSCGVELLFPPFIGPINLATNKYYLRVTPLYKPVHIQVVMEQGGTNVPFMMVQPEIDSTGKSGDTLRRLKARVKFTSEVSLPEYVAEANDNGATPGSICKSFTVSTTPGPPGEPHSACPLPPTP